MLVRTILTVSLLAWSVPGAAAQGALPRRIAEVRNPLVSTALLPGEAFGRAVAVSGDTLLVGAPLDDGLGDAAGSAYVFVRQGTGWVEQARLAGSDTAPNDRFGASVAIDGNTALIGAWGVDPGPPGTVNAGAAYVFTRSGTLWTETARLVAPSASFFDSAGKSVALEGGLAVVGATRAGKGPGLNDGAVFVYARVGGSWAFQDMLTTKDTSLIQAEFGTSVAIDAGRVLVGAGRADGAGTLSGAAYVFARSGSGWVEEAKLVGPETAEAAFGSAVDLSSDVALIGAPGVDAAFVFQRDGTAWRQVRALAGGPGEEFGTAVALDGDLAVVGAPEGSVGGQAYLYDGRRQRWAFETTIRPSTERGDRFGEALALERRSLLLGGSLAGQGDTGAVVPVDVLEDAAATYSDAEVPLAEPAVDVVRDGDVTVLGVPNPNLSGYAQVDSLADPGNSQRLGAPDGAVGDRFGSAVAVAGARIAVGSPDDDTLGGAQAGSAYVWLRDASDAVGWSFEQKLTAPDAAPNQHLGEGLALVGDDVLLVGAPGDDQAAPDAGAVYVYVRGGGGWSFASKLTAASPLAGGRFGQVLVSDGLRVVVVSSTRVHVLEGAGASWTETASIAHFVTDLEQGVDIDGPVLVVRGTPLFTTGVGSALVYRLAAGQWTLEQTLSAGGAANFGQGVAVDGDTILVTAPVEPDGSPFLGLRGALFVYRNSGGAWELDPVRRLARRVPGFNLMTYVDLDEGTAVAGSLADRGHSFVFDVSRPSFPSFCDANDGALSVCPCGNPGLQTTGCDLPQATGGVRLDVVAQVTAPSNRLSVEVTELPRRGNATVVLLRAASLAPAPAVFGDGVRCLGASNVGLGFARGTDGSAQLSAMHEPAAGGGTFHYQAWVRSAPASFCTPAGFNLSNGRSVTW